MTAPCVTPRRSDSPAIRKMRADDVPTVVQVHLKSFPGFFLTFLGAAFLRELYVATLADDDGIGIVAEDVNGIGGFVTGTAQPAGFYRRLLRQRWWRFGLAAVAPVLRRPSIIPRLLRAFSKPGHATHQEDRGTLMSIAVLPEIQGKGIGQALVRAFLAEAACKGLRQVDLTTDRIENEAANRFYQQMGFVCEQTYTTPEGRAMNEYVIDIAAQSSDGGAQKTHTPTLT